MQFRNPKLLLLACYSIAGCLGCLFLLISTLLAIMFVENLEAILSPAIMPMFYFMMVLLALYLILAMYLRCPYCKKMVIIQGFSVEAEYYKKKLGKEGLHAATSTAIMDILSKKQFICVHCNGEINV